MVGFGVAQGTGNRTLGGIILAIGAAMCVIWWWKVAGPVRAGLSLAVFAASFVVSHPLGKLIGAWPSVILVATVSALSAYFLTKPRSGLVDIS